MKIGGCFLRRRRSAMKPASIPAARSITTSIAIDRPATAQPGRLIDRQYLQSIGWRGIRQRKLNIEALLTKASMPRSCRSTGPYASSTSPPDTVATCSKRSNTRQRPESILARLQRMSATATA